MLAKQFLEFKNEEKVWIGDRFKNYVEAIIELELEPEVEEEPKEESEEPKEESKEQKLKLSDLYCDKKEKQETKTKLT